MWRHASRDRGFQTGRSFQQQAGRCEPHQYLQCQRAGALAQTHFITRTRLSEILYAVIINEDIWQTLTKEQQQILVDVSGKVEKRIWDHFTRIEADAYGFASQKGMKIADLTPNDLVAWRVCSSSILESYMTMAGEMGDQLMAAYARLRAAPCCNKAINANVDH